MRVATKYVNITRNWFDRHGVYEGDRIGRIPAVEVE